MQYDAIYKFKSIMDCSEESTIIIKDKQLDYVNNAFLNKYQDIIKQRPPDHDDDLSKYEIFLQDEQAKP